MRLRATRTSASRSPRPGLWPSSGRDPSSDWTPLRNVTVDLVARQERSFESPLKPCDGFKNRPWAESSTEPGLKYRSALSICARPGAEGARRPLGWPLAPSAKGNASGFLGTG